MIKTGKYMRLTLASVAFIFFFLPDLAVVDILPDVIGYALLFWALTPFSDLNDDMAQARSGFMKMMLVGVARVASVVFIFGLSSEKERVTSILLILFVFAVLEAIFLIPAYYHMFEGLLYLGTRDNGTAVFSRRDGGKSRTEKVRNFTIFFVIIKNTLAVLPETLALSVSSDGNAYMMNMYSNIGVARALAMIIAAVFGIIWFVKIEKYFAALRHDTPFIETVKARYEREIIPNESIGIRRMVKSAMFVFGAGALLMIDFYIDGNDGYNIIPDAIAAAFFICGIIIIRKLIPKKLALISGAAFAVYGVVTTVNWNISREFSSRYTAAEVRTKVEANNEWKTLILLAAVEAVSFFFASGTFAAILKHITDRHTGFIPKHPTVDPSVREREIHKKLYIYIILFCVSALVMPAGSILRVALFDTSSLLSDASWVVEMILAALYGITAIFAMSKINEQIEEKYMLS